MEKELIIYQSKNGSLELRTDFEKENIWATIKQISSIFDVDRSVVSRHIKKIFLDNELDNKVVCANFAHTTPHGSIKGKSQTRALNYYNLDIILAVGYRTNSNNAIKFRKWATQTLKQHITEGYTINNRVLEKNKQQFLQTLEDLKLLTKNSDAIDSKEILSLITSFSNTFFTLECFDKNNFPEKGELSQIQATAKDLKNDLLTLKQELIKKGEATELFAQEKKEGSLEGIFGNVFQSVFGQDAYPSVEEKAAHLLYFIVKNHPFNDGNKRSGAFAFVWLLQAANYDFSTKISPQTLTTLTLLIATSKPEEKEKIVGLVLLLLKK